MILSGTFVAVPLLLLQSISIHNVIGVWPSRADALSLTAMNVLLSHSIYDEDRARDLFKPTDLPRISTKVATAAATGLLLSKSETEWAALSVVFLHYFYADVKPIIAPFKPIFIGVSWGLATHNLPFDLLDIQQSTVYYPIAEIAQIAAWSNVADIGDIDDDREANVRTPATLLGRDHAQQFSLALILLSIWAHACVDRDHTYDRIYDMTSLLAFFFFNPTQRD